jgi:uncharacterized membrane protein YdjX (TVP38/TMEM64 family)
VARWYERLGVQINHPPKAASKEHALRRWFLGSGDYAHPALRWLAVPLSRAVLLAFGIALFTGNTGHGWTPLKIMLVALIGISSAAELANAAIRVSARRKANES